MTSVMTYRMDSPANSVPVDVEAKYTTRAELVTLVAGGLVMADGLFVSAAGLFYKWHAGSTEITDLPGMVPAGTVVAGHFG